MPEVLAGLGIAQVAFLHIDMNCAYPERAALEHFWDRLAPGAMVLFDDYAYYGNGALAGAIRCCGGGIGGGSAVAADGTGADRQISGKARARAAHLLSANECDIVIETWGALPEDRGNPKHAACSDHLGADRRHHVFFRGQGLVVSAAHIPARPGLRRAVHAHAGDHRRHLLSSRNSPWVG